MLGLVILHPIGPDGIGRVELAALDWPLLAVPGLVRAGLAG